MQAGGLQALTPVAPGGVEVDDHCTVEGEVRGAQGSEVGVGGAPVAPGRVEVNEHCGGGVGGWYIGKAVQAGWQAGKGG